MGPRTGPLPASSIPSMTPVLLLLLVVVERQDSGMSESSIGPDPWTLLTLASLEQMDSSSLTASSLSLHGLDDDSCLSFMVFCIFIIF